MKKRVSGKTGFGKKKDAVWLGVACAVRLSGLGKARLEENAEPEARRGRLKNLDLEESDWPAGIQAIEDTCPEQRRALLLCAHFP